jgi:hypothetical protein
MSLNVVVSCSFSHMTKAKRRGGSDNHLVKGVGQQKNPTGKSAYIHISMQVFMPSSKTEQIYFHFPPSRQHKCEKDYKIDEVGENERM